MQSKTTLRAKYCMLAAVIAIASAFGCADSGSSPTANSESFNTQSLVSSTGAMATSGNDKDPFAPAKHTVAVFLDCLRRGDEATANSMLTSKARQELQKTAWVMQPLGTPEGRYTIGRAGYPYPDQKVVLVESRWQEPSVPNHPEMAMDIVCELYEDTDGWRIAGMAVTMVGEEEALVIDFEDGAKLQQMLDLANGITPADNTSNNTSQNNHNDQPNINPPALPDFPTSESQQMATSNHVVPTLR